MTRLEGAAKWTEEREPRAVWARLPSRGKRVTALRVGRAAGLVRVWALGRVWILPAGLVGRPRRNGAARVKEAGLREEWRAYLARAADLGPHHRGRDPR